MEKVHYLVQTNTDGKRVRFAEDSNTGGLNVTIGDVLPGSFMFLEQADILLDEEAVLNLGKLLGKMYINQTGAWPKHPTLPLHGSDRQIHIEEDAYTIDTYRFLIAKKPILSSQPEPLAETRMELRDIKALRNMLNSIIERAEDGE